MILAGFLVSILLLVNIPLATHAQLPPADTTGWARHLRIYLSTQPPESLMADSASFSPENIRFYSNSYNGIDSVLVAIVEANSGSGGPQIAIMGSTAYQPYQLLLNTYGFVSQIVAGKNHTIIEKYTRGYSWGQLLWRIAATGQGAKERAVARAGVPLQILRELPNITKACKKSLFDCAELYGTLCDTVHTSAKGERLLLVYNPDKSPWLFSGNDLKRGYMEVLGFLYLEKQGRMYRVAVVPNAKLVYLATETYQQMPVLVVEDKKAVTRSYRFDGKQYVYFIAATNKTSVKKLLYKEK
jgi:hypothetical protein